MAKQYHVFAEGSVDKEECCNELQGDVLSGTSPNFGHHVCAEQPVNFSVRCLLPRGCDSYTGDDQMKCTLFIACSVDTPPRSLRDVLASNSDRLHLSCEYFCYRRAGTSPIIISPTCFSQGAAVIAALDVGICCRSRYWLLSIPISSPLRPPPGSNTALPRSSWTCYFFPRTIKPGLARVRFVLYCYFTAQSSNRTIQEALEVPSRWATRSARRRR